MRDVRFKDLPAVGPRPGHWMHGTLEQFVVRLSPVAYALRVQHVIPNLDAWNKELQKGVNQGQTTVFSRAPPEAIFFP